MNKLGWHHGSKVRSSTNILLLWLVNTAILHGLLVDDGLLHLDLALSQHWFLQDCLRRECLNKG